jgi:hypothetical protein
MILVNEKNLTLEMIKPSVLYSSNGVLDSFSLKFLEKIGVKKENPSSIISVDILPIYEKFENETEKIDINTHLEHAIFIRNHFNELSNEVIENIRKYFLILTQDDSFEYPTYLYLSSFYQFEEEPTLEEILPDAKFVSSKYLEFSINSQDVSIEVSKWRDFWENLAIPLSPSISKIEIEINSKKSLKKKWGNSGAQLIDFECTKDFEKLFENEKNIIRSLEFIDYHWSYYQNFSEQKIFIKDQRIINMGFEHLTEPSSMMNFLKNQKLKSSNKSICKISEMWFGNLISIYGNSFPFFTGNLLNTNFRKKLNLFEDLNMSNLMKQLNSFKNRSLEEFNDKNQIKLEFNSFLKLFSNIFQDDLLYEDVVYDQKTESSGLVYFQLERKIKKNLWDTFSKDEKLIYFKDEWYSSSDLFWEQDPILFQHEKDENLKTYFDLNERNIYKPFLISVGVYEKRPFSDFIQNLETLMKEYIHGNIDQSIIFKEYFKINEWIKTNIHSENMGWIKNYFEKIPILITSKGVVTLKKNLIFYYDTLDKLYDCYKNEIYIFFIPNDVLNLKFFLSQLSILNLNSKLKIQIENFTFQKDDKETERMRKLFIYIDKYLQLKNVDIYEGIKQKLKKLQNEFEVQISDKPLNVIYQIHNTGFILSEKCKFQESDFNFFISKKRPTTNEILNELMKSLELPTDDDFKTFFYTIYTMNDPEEFMSFMGYTINHDSSEEEEEEEEIEENETLSGNSFSIENVNLKYSQNLQSEMKKQDEFFKMIEEMVEQSIEEDEEDIDDEFENPKEMNDYEFNYIFHEIYNISSLVSDKEEKKSDFRIEKDFTRLSKEEESIREEKQRQEEEIEQLQLETRFGNQFHTEQEQDEDDEEEDEETMNVNELFVKKLFKSTNIFKIEVPKFITSIEDKSSLTSAPTFQISQTIEKEVLNLVLNFEMKRLKSFTQKDQTNEFVIDVSTFEKKENFKKNSKFVNILKHLHLFDQKMNHHVISVNPQTLFIDRLIVIKNNNFIDFESHEWGFGENEFFRDYFYVYNIKSLKDGVGNIIKDPFSYSMNNIKYLLNIDLTSFQTELKFK